MHSMTTREVSVGHGTLSLETGKLAKQAGGAVIVRLGDSVVLVTACRAASPRERRFPAAHGRLPRERLRVGPHPRRLLQARRQARRKGSAHLPRDRPADPAAVPGRLALRNADHRRWCSRPTAKTTPTSSPSPAPRPRSRISDVPFEKTIAGVRVGLVDGQYVINPTFAQRKESKLDLIVAGSKDGLVMVEAGAKEVSEEQVVERARSRARRDQEDRRRDRRHGQGGRQEEGRVHREDDRPDARGRVRRQDHGAARQGDADPRQARELRGGRPGPRRPARDDSRRRSRSARPTRRRSSSTPRKRSSTTRSCNNNVRLDGRKLDQIRPIWIETSVLPAHARLGGVHARRNPGARHLHARHRRRCAEDRDVRGRNLEELHAPLQLPAVLGR